MSDEGNRISLDQIRDRWSRMRAVIQAPRVRIEMFGDAAARTEYLGFTARHPRFRFTAAKHWGVALLPLPERAEDYLPTASQYVRRQRNRAMRLGYRAVMISPAERLSEILEINLSSEVRQGRRMPSLYTNQDVVATTIGRRPSINGIEDARGRLRAYANVIDVGGTYILSTFLGHAADLSSGVMYLLLADAIARSVAARREDGSPSWLMYDTFWGASRGLAFFKERAGFRPYTVDWVWRDSRT
jgi:hypothetical protein